MQKSNSQEETKNSNNCTPNKKDTHTIKSPTPKKPLIKINLHKRVNMNNEEKEDKVEKNKNEEISYKCNERILKIESDGNRIVPFNKPMETKIDKKKENNNVIAPSRDNQIIEDGGVDNFTFDDKDGDIDECTKKKKDWISWSLNEKLLFYEAIASGANYTSLQKLFKNMNDVY
jgi:hypothetical protein